MNEIEMDQNNEIKAKTINNVTNSTEDADEEKGK